MAAMSDCTHRFTCAGPCRCVWLSACWRTPGHHSAWTARSPCSGSPECWSTSRGDDAKSVRSKEIVTSEISLNNLRVKIHGWPGWRASGGRPAGRTAAAPLGMKRRWRKTWWRGRRLTRGTTPAATERRTPCRTARRRAACTPANAGQCSPWLSYGCCNNPAHNKKSVLALPSPWRLGYTPGSRGREKLRSLPLKASGSPGVSALLRER